MRLIRDKFDIDIQVVGNESADFFNLKTFFHGRRSSFEARGTKVSHDDESLNLQQSEQGISPQL
jgi:hypothetical protein